MILFDDNVESLFPAGWQAELITAASDLSAKVAHELRSTTTRGHKTGLRYSVVDGNAVAIHLRWLWNAYRTALRELVCRATGEDLVVGDDTRSAITLNTLDSASQYDVHVDSNPYTGLLFATTMPLWAGGELEFLVPSDGPSLVRPVAGRFLVFDGTQAPHTIRPIRGKFQRVSVPMNFYRAGKRQDRPTDLDSYVFGTSRSSKLAAR